MSATLSPSPFTLYYAANFMLISSFRRVVQIPAFTTMTTASVGFPFSWACWRFWRARYLSWPTPSSRTSLPCSIENTLSWETWDSQVFSELPWKHFSMLVLDTPTDVTLYCCLSAGAWAFFYFVNFCNVASAWSK